MISVSLYGTEYGYIFTCGTATPTLHSYDSVDCSGPLLNSTTDFGNNEIQCDGIICAVVILKQYINSLGSNESLCEASSDYSISPLVLGCIGLGQNLTHSGKLEYSDGNLTAWWYNKNGDCSGTPADSLITYTDMGCSDDGKYYELEFISQSPTQSPVSPSPTSSMSNDIASLSLITAIFIVIAAICSC